MNILTRSPANFPKPNGRSWTAIRMATDAICTVICVLLTVTPIHESLSPAQNPSIWVTQTYIALITVITFYLIGLYHWIIDLSSTRIHLTIIAGSLISAANLHFFANALSLQFSLASGAIYAALLFLASGGTRLLWSHFIAKPFLSNRQPVVIYGAGDTGIQLSEALKHSAHYVPLAFLDDDPSLQGTSINGLQVYNTAAIHHLKKNLPVNAIVLADTSKSFAKNHEIMSAIKTLGIEVKIIPTSNESKSDIQKDQDIRLVRPEDLFGRRALPTDDETMQKNIDSKVVLVTGAGGTIGGELCRQIIKYKPSKLVLFDVSESSLNDISTDIRKALARDEPNIPIDAVLGSVHDTSCINALMRTHAPETIFHCAAYNHPAPGETDAVEAVLNNSLGTKVLAEAACTFGVKNFVLISTGAAMRPYTFAAATRRVAELICQAMTAAPTQTVFLTVRAGNVLSSKNAIISNIDDQIRKGGPVSIHHARDHQYLMLPSEAAQLIIQASGIAEGGELYFLDMGTPIDILELTEVMIGIRGLQPCINAQSEPKGTKTINIIVDDNKDHTSTSEIFGRNPEGTEHPRILRAREDTLSKKDIDEMMALLERACNRQDAETIRAVLACKPIFFSINDDSGQEPIWSRLNDSDQHSNFTMLRIVKSTE